MRVRLHIRPPSFLIAAGPFLRSDPFSANVIAVMAAAIAAGIRPDSPDYLWATVQDGDSEVLGVAMHTPPYAVFVSRMPREAAVALAGAFANAGRELPGVNGASESTAAFADAWAARTGQTSTVITAQRMYRLAQLSRPRDVPGEATVAAAPDLDLIARWLAAFRDEAQPDGPGQDWVAYAEQRVAAEQVFLWRDGGRPVALAGVSAPAAGVARVGPVYTPPRSRRHCYGSAVTAAATAAALANGAEHVALYTDLANPTSNSIYQTIGYRPDHDAEERSFARPT